MSEPGQKGRAVSRRAVVRRAGVGALAAGLGMAAAGSPASAQSSAASGIVGTWRLRVSITAARRDHIDFLAIFIPGGVFLGLDSPVEGASPRVGGPEPMDHEGAHAGQWLQLPGGVVRAKTLQLSYSARSQVTHEEHTSYNLTYDGATDTIGGTFEWRELRPDGQVLLVNTGSVMATRVAVDA
jgi:hypothetical protein